MIFSGSSTLAAFHVLILSYIADGAMLQPMSVTLVVGAHHTWLKAASKPFIAFINNFFIVIATIIAMLAGSFRLW